MTLGSYQRSRVPQKNCIGLAKPVPALCSQGGHFCCSAQHAHKAQILRHEECWTLKGLFLLVELDSRRVVCECLLHDAVFGQVWIAAKCGNLWTASKLHGKSNALMMQATAMCCFLRCEALLANLPGAAISAASTYGPALSAHMAGKGRSSVRPIETASKHRVAHDQGP